MVFEEVFQREDDGKRFESELVFDEKVEPGSAQLVGVIALKEAHREVLVGQAGLR